METKKLTGKFYDYMNTNFGKSRSDIENLLLSEIKLYLEKYIGELEKDIYHYSVIIAERTEYYKERTEYTLSIGKYEIIIVKRLLSISVYMKKTSSKYRKALKIYSLRTLEETIQNLKNQLTLKEIIYI